MATLHDLLGDATPPEPDREVVLRNISLARQNQHLQDINRIERKAQRNYFRVETTARELAIGLDKAIQECGKSLFTYTPRGGVLNKEAPVGVLHLSDVHANELVDLPHNRYDFEVMAKRLQKLAEFTKLQGKTFGIERLVICFGGDLLNSDRRQDEVMHMATNRMRAMALAAHLFAQFIADLRETFFIDTFAVTGNEGRVGKELNWGEHAATDNFDAGVYYCLQHVFSGREDPGLRMHQLQANEQVFKIHNETILLVHGHQLRCGDQKAVQSVIGKFATQGTLVSHVLAGHIHSSMVSDYVSRNSSMVGSNSYSGDGLQLASKAAQNLHVITTDSLYGFKVDLQRTGDLPGYSVIPQLCAYAAKSADKLWAREHPPIPIVVVV